MAQPLSSLANKVTGKITEPCGLKQIIGHHEIKERLFQAQKHGRLPSTFLLVGPDGVGRKKLALALAQSLVCEVPVSQRELGGCGSCGPCLRIAKAQSEALLLIAPEKNTIKIEQTSRVLEFLSLQAISKARVIIIDSAHLMNPTAANTLLKILEEPPADCYFFLIAPGPQHVLPTLRSRAQVVRFSGLSLEEMKTKSTAAEWALRACQGSFSRLAGFQDPDELETRDFAGRFLEMWLSDRRAFMTPEWKNMIKDRVGALSLTRYVGLLLRDAIISKVVLASSAKEIQKNSQIINADKIDLILKLTSLELSLLQKMSQNIFRLEGALHANRDTQLSFEEFWLS